MKKIILMKKLIGKQYLKDKKKILVKKEFKKTLEDI